MKHASKHEDNQEQLVFAKRVSHQVYNTIPKSREWLTINYVVNATGTTMPGFYIFRGKRICDNYI
jgi:hypothetical protein